MTQQDHSQTPQRARVLVVADQPQLLSLLESAFESKGYAVVTAQDGRAAWWQIRQERPQIVVCDYLMPYMDGGELLLKVRSHERFRELPFVMLGAPEEVSDGEVAARVSEILPKPHDQASLESLLVRVAAVLERANTPTGSQRALGLQGDLAHLSLPDLMQLLHQNRRTGRLEVRQRKRSFSFFFLKGLLLQAEGYPANIKSEKALFRALLEDRGAFLFHSEEADALKEIEPDPTLGSLEFLLMEGLRQRDEIERLLSQLPANDVLFVRTQKTPASDLSDLAVRTLSSFEEAGEGISLRLLLDRMEKEPDHSVLECLLTLHNEGYLLQRPLEVASSGALDTLPLALDTRPYTPAVPFTPSKRFSQHPVFLDFVDALQENQEEQALAILERAFSEGFSAELLYRKLLGGAIRQLLDISDLQGAKALPSLPVLHTVFDRVMERLWPFFAGRPPVHGMIVMGRPVGESGSLDMLVSFLRAAGFGVIDLGSRVTPSRFLESVIATGASLLCLMLRTEAGVQMTHYIRQLLDRQGMQKIPILVGGPFLNRFPDQFRFTGADALALDAFDLIRKAYQLLEINASESSA
jgi:DNA-binding response OmpR family regulator/methanogenic corrinoid protein MtbC1